MHCPYCQKPAFETASECTGCGLSLEKVESLMGAVPAGISRPVADLAQLFKKGELRTLGSAIEKFEQRFPQAHFSVLTTRVPSETNLGVYAFWLFNKGGICREMERGADNRNILLTIDAENNRANLMVGYGLEPFVGSEHLESALGSARPDFKDHRYLQGTLATISTVTTILAKVSSTMDDTYGIQLEAIYEAETSAKRGEQAGGY